MLLIIQFPIVDSRLFIDSSTKRLGYPVWPIPKPDEDFIRYFGAIRRRWRGGLTGWISENVICEANRAIRFREFLQYSYYDDSELYDYLDYQIEIPLSVAFRRFFFDGLAVGKVEVGLSIHTYHLWDTMPSSEVSQLFEYILQSPVRIRNLSGDPFDCSLIAAGKYLADLYLLGSSQSETSTLQSLPEWWVQSCQPILFLTQDDDYDADIPYPGKSISLDNRIAGTLSHHFVPATHGKTVQLWCFNEKDTYWWYSQNNWDFRQPKYHETRARADARKLRIFLLRLHAERECLKQVLRNIDGGRISVSRNTKASDNLQHYLNLATKRIARLEYHSDKLTESTIGELARKADSYASPGEIDSIIAALHNLDIRRNILNKVEGFLQKETVVIMGDQYNVSGQAGAVGHNAHAHDMTFNQIGKQIEDSVDLLDLAKELAKLREEMKGQASSLEEEISIGEIAKAEQAAKNKKSSDVAKYLNSAGKWALDVATKLSVPLAIAALKQALGL